MFAKYFHHLLLLGQCLRVAEGCATFPSGQWLCQDVLSHEFIETVMDGSLSNPYDLVISNPPFEHALAFLYVALMMITDRRQR